MTPANKPADRPPNAPPMVRMIITFDPVTGNLNVDGIPNSHLLAYGMLQMAADVVQQSRQQGAQQQSRVMTPLGPANLI